MTPPSHALLWQITPSTPGPQGLSTTPECRESSRGWHLIPAVYFWACPSATDKCYVGQSWCAEMVSVDVRWLVWSFIFVLDLMKGPRTGKKRSAQQFCPHNIW
jgi:hypothetical protein